MSMHRPILGELVDQPGHRPTAKLTAVGGTGVAVAVVLYLAGRAGLAMPEPVAEAIVLLGAWLGGYVKRDKAVAAVVTRVEHALTPLAPMLPELEAAAASVLEPAGPVKTVTLLPGPEAVRGPEA